MSVKQVLLFILGAAYTALHTAAFPPNWQFQQQGQSGSQPWLPFVAGAAHQQPCDWWQNQMGCGGWSYQNGGQKFADQQPLPDNGGFQQQAPTFNGRHSRAD